jgi:hypothetical protein
MLSKTIPSYVYQQYYDDSDIQAFCANYNAMAQDYVTWFFTASLPIYSMQSGQLLDWSVQGLYGIPRPTLGNTLATDDVYQRVVTWAFYKGDGKVFNIRWLKRRIMRFLEGINGTDPGVNQTYQISVRFGAPNIVYINILGGIAEIVSGSFFNTDPFNVRQYNELNLSIQHYADTTLEVELQEAINAGVCELPFQFQFIVSVNP